MPETKKRPGPVPKLSRDAVLQVARELAPDEVTLAAIGARLGVTGPALYRYFEDRTAILEALANEAREKLTPPDESLPWEQWLREMGAKERDLWRNHPDLYDAANYRAISRPSLTMTIAGIRVLQAAGFTLTDSLSALTIVSELAHSFGWTEAHRDTLLDPELGELLLPYLEDHVREHGPFDVVGMMDAAIDLALDGLRTRLRKPARR